MLQTWVQSGYKVNFSTLEKVQNGFPLRLVGYYVQQGQMNALKKGWPAEGRRLRRAKAGLQEGPRLRPATVQLRSLRCALESLESAYYEVRQRSVQSLAEDEALGVSRSELMETLKKAGCRLTETEQDVLWEAMDTNQDGLLSASELGLSDAPMGSFAAQSFEPWRSHPMGRQSLLSARGHIWGRQGSVHRGSMSRL
eukprot:s748_g11.t1